MAGPADAEAEALLHVVDALVARFQRRAVAIARVHALDHPVDQAVAEDIMLVLQDLEMLASLRANLAGGSAARGPSA